MNLLIDIGHPAHVHLFRCLAHEMKKKGHHVFFTHRDREAVKELLEYEGLQSVSLGISRKGVLGKLWSSFINTWVLLKIIKRVKADLLLSHGSISLAWASFLCRVPHISLEDTYNMEQVALYRPFTKVILTGDYDHPSLGDKEFRYPGYHELAYLHPNRFSADMTIREQMCIPNHEKLIVLRFVSWNATHDVGMKGISNEKKIEIVHRLGKLGKVVISSEGLLPDEIEHCRFNLPKHKLHDALASADLIFSESATIASEGAVLGTFSIYLDDKGRFYTRDQEKRFGLVKSFSLSDFDVEAAIMLAEKVLSESRNKTVHRICDEMIDVTKFLLWFLEAYQAGGKMDHSDIVWSNFQ